MKKIRKGDDVMVTCGRDKGKRGLVDRVLPDGRLIVRNINMIKKHTKPNPNAGVEGGILERAAPLQASNVMLFNPAKQAADRVGFKMLDNGKKVRYFKSDGSVVVGS